MKDKLKFVAGALLLLLLIWAFVYYIVPDWFWHPLGYCTGTPHQVELCKGYNSWSGILGSFIASVPQWLIALALFWRHNNCGHKGCWNTGHKHPGHGQPMCDIHYDETPHKLRKRHHLPEKWRDAKHHSLFRA